MSQSNYKLSLSRAHILNERISKEIREIARNRGSYSYPLGATDLLLAEKEYYRKELREKILAKKQENENHIALSLELIQAQEALRNAVAKGNVDYGVSARLTALRGLEMQLELYGDIKSPVDFVELDDLDESLAKQLYFVESMTETDKTAYLSRWSQVVSLGCLGGQKVVESLIKDIKRKMMKINDEVREINGSAFIEVSFSDEIAEILNLK